MDQSTSGAIERWLAAWASRPLAVYATLDVETLDPVAEDVRRQFGLPPVHLGRELGAALLDSRPDRRIRDAERWLLERCGETGDRPLLVVDVDLLFDPDLERGSQARLDPLALLIRASRTRPLLVLWPGACAGSTLSYAAAGHDHYRFWRGHPAHIVHTGVRNDS